MSTIYILSHNGKLKKKDTALYFSAYDGTVTKIFPHRTDQLVVIGNMQLTGSALKMLMRNQIDTVFLGTNGKFNGKLEFRLGKNVFLRQKQFELLKDQYFPLSFAKSVVAGKIKNQLSFMQRIYRKRDVPKSYEGVIQRMKKLEGQVQGAEAVNSLRGFEGTAAKQFFSVFQHNLVPDWVVFNGRSKNPPLDNVNAVLSFLYTLLFYRVDSAIHAEGLDNGVGYLHELEYTRPSLSFDLMEEFRTPIADTLCCMLFNKAVLDEADFREEQFSEESIDYPLQPDDTSEETEDHSIISERKGVLLNREGLKKVITHFEKKLETEIYYKPLLKRISYMKLIHEQVKHFKRVISGEEKEYKPVYVK